jgi:hypothetical protein
MRPAKRDNKTDPQRVVGDTRMHKHAECGVRTHLTPSTSTSAPTASRASSPRRRVDQSPDDLLGVAPRAAAASLQRNHGGLGQPVRSTSTQRRRRRRCGVPPSRRPRDDAHARNQHRCGYFTARGRRRQRRRSDRHEPQTQERAEEVPRLALAAMQRRRRAATRTRHSSTAKLAAT